MEVIISMLEDSAYAVIAFVFMFVAKKLDDFRTSYNEDREIEEESNLALGFRKAGFSVALAIGFLGSISSLTEEFVPNVVGLLIDGALLVVIMFAARMVNDLVLLRKIDNDQAVKDRNVAVGMAEFGSLVATGLVMNGAFSGEGGGIPSVLLFAVLGQICLVVLAVIYEFITPFKVGEEIKKNNPAAGIGLAGMLIALGIILRASIAGDYVSMVDDVIAFSLCAGMGIVLLLIMRKAVDIFFLPHTTLATEVARDQNAAALLVAQGAVVAVAILIAAVV
ncbi:MAG TPA: DUF350 domain-containing protein [Candidatus Hydrogenedentes bacterium]|nr:DUF350 domain-containing protein [Candidatus Hydrogenedentota bacterium]